MEIFLAMDYSAQLSPPAGIVAAELRANASATHENSTFELIREGKEKEKKRKGRDETKEWAILNA